MITWFHVIERPHKVRLNLVMKRLLSLILLFFTSFSGAEELKTDLAGETLQTTMLRRQPTLAGRTRSGRVNKMKTLQKGQRVSIHTFSPFLQTIKNKRGPWVGVEYQGLKGWIFYADLLIWPEGGEVEAEINLGALTRSKMNGYQNCLKLVGEVEGSLQLSKKRSFVQVERKPFYRQGMPCLEDNQTIIETIRSGTYRRQNNRLILRYRTQVENIKYSDSCRRSDQQRKKPVELTISFAPFKCNGKNGLIGQGVANPLVFIEP